MKTLYGNEDQPNLPCFGIDMPLSDKQITKIHQWICANGGSDYESADYACKEDYKLYGANNEGESYFYSSKHLFNNNTGTYEDFKRLKAIHKLTKKVKKLACFEEVSKVIGEQQAVIELSKVLSNVTEALGLDEDAELISAFCWIETPQSEEFWDSIDDGNVPQELQEKISQESIPDAFVLENAPKDAQRFWIDDDGDIRYYKEENHTFRHRILRHDGFWINLKWVSGADSWDDATILPTPTQQEPSNKKEEDTTSPHQPLMIHLMITLNLGSTSTTAEG